MATRYSDNGGTGSGPQRDKFWPSTGVAIMLAAGGATIAKFPPGLDIGAAAVGLAMIVGSFVPWRAPLRSIGRGLGRGMQFFVEEGRSDASSRTCAAAVAMLDALLAKHDRLARRGHLFKLWAKGQLIAEYEYDAKDTVVNAIHKVWQVATVPPEIRRYAEQPRTRNDLQILRDWLSDRAD
jgi:hypothetical protein